MTCSFTNCTWARFRPVRSPSRFIAATNKLDYLKNLGVNAVELMPIMEFGNGGNSWGYDPAQLFAADNAQYGGPDALQDLCPGLPRPGHRRAAGRRPQPLRAESSGYVELRRLGRQQLGRGRRDLLFPKQLQSAKHALRRHAAQCQQQSGGQFHLRTTSPCG